MTLDARGNPIIDPAKFAAYQKAKGMRQGGGVNGSDTVPAMLTPGEFVMSKTAVQQHGVGYMKNLNRGRVPGFRRGGLIGNGNVAYRQDGGLMSKMAGAIGLDPSKVEGVLNTFNETFGTSLKGFETNFGTLGDKLGELVSAFTGGFKMDHKFNGDIALNVNIANKDAIVEAVKVGIQPDLEAKITELVNAGIKDIKGKP